MHKRGKGERVHKRGKKKGGQSEGRKDAMRGREKERKGETGHKQM